MINDKNTEIRPLTEFRSCKDKIENDTGNIIYADPPWQFRVWNRTTGLGRSAESHYTTMRKEEIQQLPVQNICAKDCVLFLWVTAPCLLEGLELVKKMGF